MSRTIRCRNAEIENEQNSWRRQGKKTGLQYTGWTDDGGYYDTNRVYVWKDGTKHHPYLRYLEHPVAMEGRERYRRWRSMHGESSHANQRTPGKFYRQTRMAENRSINKQEFNRWLHYAGEYEPMFETEPRSHYWDWS